MFLKESYCEASIRQRFTRQVLMSLLFSALAPGQSAPGYAHSAIEDIRAGKYADAAAVLEAGLKVSSDDSRLWTLQGLTLARLGKQEQSLAAYEHALEISPNYLPP